MARIGVEKKVVLHLDGGAANLFFRPATNEETNDYFSKGLVVKGEDRVRQMSHLRGEMFDKLLTRVEALEDKDGNPLDAEGAKKEIPTSHKAAIIIGIVDNGLSFDIKN